MTRTDLLSRAAELRSRRTPFVLATVVRAQRPTSAKAGDTALVLPDGTLDGFVGGTCAESTVRLTGLQLLASGRSMLLRITPEPGPPEPGQPEPAGRPERSGRPEGPDEGLVTVANPCLSGGTLEIFLEAMIPAPLVRVFGDAPVARALVEIGGAAGYEMVTGTDPDEPVPADACAVVVASHGREEEPVLVAALRAGVPYVALVASRRRGAAVLGALPVGEPERARVRCPAGLDLGARTPPEVAVSILAEIIASRYRTEPGSEAETGSELDAGAGQAAEEPVTEVAIDPVCGMSVAIAPASLSSEHDGRTWYFCGSGCRRAFADAPERYLT